ncbi:MAG TPA: malate synthase A [Holophagaceae bacterium]|nr:malate synthase A [Holophagaceae bacterium]
MTQTLVSPARWNGPEAAALLTPEVLARLAELQRRYGGELRGLLAERQVRQEGYDRGERPRFLPYTEKVRSGPWQVAPLPDLLQDRRVEITGPPERRMMLHALNSGAKVYMADFEDSLAPVPEKLVQGQLNLQEAVRGTLADGELRLKADAALLMVRPRGLHLVERHLVVDGTPMAAAFFDAALFLLHNALELVARGLPVCLYLPKLEHHLEARLWNTVLEFIEEGLDLPLGTVKVTVLIETLPAAFQMEEILFELRKRAVGLNLGRWDYLFSVLKVHRMDRDAVLPDRGTLRMELPFLQAYAKRLVQVCHRRGALALGGMAALVPQRRDPDATERALQAVRADKLREVRQGCDGTWVAHPDLVPVALEVFTHHVEGVNQRTFIPEGEVNAAQLLELPRGPVTAEGLRRNLRVALRYLEAWLRGEGCVALDGLMEDAATAEISRMQLWQWVRHGVGVEGLGPLDRSGFHGHVYDVFQSLRAELGPVAVAESRLLEASELLEELILDPVPEAFLTPRAYALLLTLSKLQEIA